MCLGSLWDVGCRHLSLSASLLAISLVPYLAFAEVLLNLFQGHEMGWAGLGFFSGSNIVGIIIVTYHYHCGSIVVVIIIVIIIVSDVVCNLQGLGSSSYKR